MEDNIAAIVDKSDDYISVNCGVALWEMANGLVWLEEDYRVAGEVWRVHLSDPDPLPSDPHAHCIDGKFKSSKLHLGTRQLFTSKNKPLDRYLQRRQFDMLIEQVQRKFPHITFPLPS
jgi:hypothetical protein